MKIGVSTSAFVEEVLASMSGFLNPSNLFQAFCKKLPSEIELIEIPSDAFANDIKALISFLKTAGEGSALSIHLPYTFIDLTSIYEGLRRASVSVISEIISHSRSMVKHYIMHPFAFFGEAISTIPLKTPVKSKILNILINNFKKSLSEIIRSTGIEPRRLLLENMERSDFDIFYPVIKELDLSVCIDIGHLILQDKDPKVNITIFLDRLKEIHLHDVMVTRYGINTFIKKDHQALGDGIVDFTSLIKYLRELNYTEYLVIEVKDVDSTLRSIKYLMKLLE